MVLELYQLPFSAPCRSVLMLLKDLGLDCKLTNLNLLEGEHLKPEFLKINPQHCIPTLVDDGTSIWESRAILAYLANKYAPDSDLYPKDPLKRAAVDRQLYYDACSIYGTLGAWMYPQIKEGKPADDAALKLFHDKMEILDTILGSSPYAAGDKRTIADLSLLCSITTAECVSVDVRKHPNVAKWMDKLKEELPYYDELVTKPCEGFKAFFESRAKPAA